MGKKIEAEYGSEAAACAQAATKDDLEALVKCIMGAIEDGDPVAILANLTAWSLECAV